MAQTPLLAIARTRLCPNCHQRGASDGVSCSHCGASLVQVTAFPTMAALYNAKPIDSTYLAGRTGASTKLHKPA